MAERGGRWGDDGETRFGLRELFFSRTDGKGVIRSANSVFVRVSGYAAEELVGAPHNLVRHPSMPRIVFRVLWDRLKAGRPVAAYVLNRAKDGSPYWVLALARPVSGGFLSVRMLPTTARFAAVEPLYRELRDTEAGIERDGGTRSEAMDRSEAVLAARLGTLGAGGYDEFMTAAVVDEVRARRATVASTDESPDRSGAAAVLGTLARALDDELTRLDGSFTLERELARSCADLIRLADEGSTLAFNAELAGGRLGADGAALNAVAVLMREVGPAIVRDAEALLARIEAARAALDEIGFGVALASLQTDMARAFLTELADGTAVPPGAAENAAILVNGVHADTTRVVARLSSMSTDLAAVAEGAAGLRRSLAVLGAIERNGRVEAARTTRAEAFHTLFDQVRAEVASVHAETERIETLVRAHELGADRDRRREVVALLDRLAAFGDGDLVPAAGPRTPPTP